MHASDVNPHSLVGTASHVAKKALDALLDPAMGVHVSLEISTAIKGFVTQLTWKQNQLIFTIIVMNLFSQHDNSHHSFYQLAIPLGENISFTSD